MEEVYGSLNKLLTGNGAKQNIKPIQLQVSTLIKVIGEDAHEVFLHLFTGMVMMIISRYSQS